MSFLRFQPKVFGGYTWWFNVKSPFKYCNGNLLISTITLRIQTYPAGLMGLEPLINDSRKGFGFLLVG